MYQKCIFDTYFFTFVDDVKRPYLSINKMVDAKPKKLKKRIFNSWITSLISISLVLVMMGTLGLILINARKLSEYVREKIGFTVVLHDDIKEVEIDQLQKTLSASDFAKSCRYIDKETAATELSSKLGEDFVEFLGYNPLFSSIEIKLFARYTNPDSLLALEKKLLKYYQVKEVYYQKSLLQVINQNVKRISILLLGISGLLGFIFVALINNTIRMSIYSQRFTINTMQMVGAANAFIRKPFLQRSLFLGIYGAFIAIAIISISLYSYKNELQGLITMNEVYSVLYIYIFVLIIGIAISLLSTFFAVNKFLKLKFDELFY